MTKSLSQNGLIRKRCTKEMDFPLASWPLESPFFGYSVLRHFDQKAIRRLASELVLLPAGGLGFLHAAKFLGGILQPQMGVSVERDADFAVAHQVLERLWVHPGFGLIAAVGMAADVRRDVGHLDPVDIVVAFDHMVEPVLPVHGHFRQAVLIQKQKAAVPIDHTLDPRGRPVLDDGAEALLDVAVIGSLRVPAWVLVS